MSKLHGKPLDENGAIAFAVSKNESETLDRKWWREQGIDACMDRMVLMNSQLAALQAQMAGKVLVPIKFVDEWLWQEKWTGRTTMYMPWSPNHKMDAAKMCADYHRFMLAAAK